MHSGTGDLASRLVFGNAAERPCAFGSPSVLQKLFHAVESQAFDKSRVDIGTMSARIGIRLSARTMAGAHITEATPPTKTRLRVRIEPPNISVSDLAIVRGQVMSHHTTECLLFLSRKSWSWWLTGQRRDIPVQAVNPRSEGASRRARSWAEHPHHRRAESHSVFQLASVHPLVRPPAGDHGHRRYARSQKRPSPPHFW
jgi:hypothetical protein